MSGVRVLRVARKSSWMVWGLANGLSPYLERCTHDKAGAD